MISQAKNPIKREDDDLSVFKENRHLRGATFVACAPFVAAIFVAGRSAAEGARSVWGGLEKCRLGLESITP